MEPIVPTATVPAPATIEASGGRHWWRCPNCGQKLGEVVGERVIIEAGRRRLRMPVRTEPEQDCPRCGAASAIKKGT